MISQEDLDTLKLHYGSIAPNKVMELIEAYETTVKAVEELSAINHKTSGLFDATKAYIQRLEDRAGFWESEYNELDAQYQQSRKWSSAWKEAATLHRYRADNWLSLARAYSRELGRVRQWAKAWKLAAKHNRYLFKKYRIMWQDTYDRFIKYFASYKLAQRCAAIWKLAAKRQRENFNRLYKVALATVETHETVKTYGEDATEINE